jgi:hypothetical protein
MKNVPNNAGFIPRGHQVWWFPRAALLKNEPFFFKRIYLFLFRLKRIKLLSGDPLTAWKFRHFSTQSKNAMRRCLARLYYFIRRGNRMRILTWYHQYPNLAGCLQNA